MPPEIFSSWDDFFYPGTQVLRNKPGLRNPDVLKDFEYEQSKIRADELKENPIRGSFDLRHLQKIHAYLFQDVYEWAGQIRSVDMFKGSSEFARHEYIESYGAKLAAELASESHLKQLSKAQFVERLAYHYAEWNALHPFREGNGRSTREFVGQLSQEAGYTFDQSRIDNKVGQWNIAAARSFQGDLAEVKQIFQEAVRPTRSMAFEHLPAAEALSKHPELKPAFDGYEAIKREIALRYAGNESVCKQFTLQARLEVIRRLDTGKVWSDPIQQINNRSATPTSPLPKKTPDLER